MLVTFPVAEINSSDEKEKFVLTFQFLGYSLSGAGETCSVERRLGSGSVWQLVTSQSQTGSREQGMLVLNPHSPFKSVQDPNPSNSVTHN